MKQPTNKPARRSALHFHVGPFVYHVRMPASPIPDPDRPGKHLLALAVAHDREILISPQARPRSRFEYILHELRHAWLFHVPKPRTAEEDADLAAMMMASLTKDLREQGGEAAFNRLRRARPTAATIADPAPAEDPFEREIPAALQAAKPMMRIAQG